MSVPPRWSSPRPAVNTRVIEFRTIVVLYTCTPRPLLRYPDAGAGRTRLFSVKNRIPRHAACTRSVCPGIVGFRARRSSARPSRAYVTQTVYRRRRRPSRLGRRTRHATYDDLVTRRRSRNVPRRSRAAADDPPPPPPPCLNPRRTVRICNRLPVVTFVTILLDTRSRVRRCLFGVRHAEQHINRYSESNSFDVKHETLTYKYT